MRKTISIALLTFLVLNISSSYSQENRQICGQDLIMEEMKTKNPEQYARFLESHENFLEFRQNQTNAAQRSGAVTLIVPIVVHVVHNNGNGNLTLAQIQAGIAELNRDFQKNNPDTGNVRPLFRPLAGGMDIEFRLARKDPQGNCTDGIVRVNSPVTSIATSSDPLKNVAPAWPRTKYFNIWTTNAISDPTGSAQIGGFAFKPAFPSAHGATILNIYMGNNQGSLRTLTHEAGHSFNLDHTFGPNNGGVVSCGSNCETTGDFICDTPPIITALFPCNTSQNSCSNDMNGGSPGNPNPFTTNVVDQIENFMGYNQNGPTCQTMYTQGQIDYMEDAIINFPLLVTLLSPANNIATGTDDAYWFTAPTCAPVAEFRYNKSLVCGGGSVNFTDESYNAPQDGTWTWAWSFPGGTPSSSTLQNPTITYNNPGVFGVTLTTSNSAGSSSPRTKTGIITALAGVGTLAPGTEDFTNAQFPNNIIEPEKSWVISQNPANVVKWERSTTAFFSPPASVWVNQYFATNGNENYLTTAGFDLSSFSDSIFLQYKLAHAPSSHSGLDQLRIMVSTDCGVTWSTIQTLFSSFIYSNGGVSADNFVPNGSSEWITKENDLSSTAGLSNVQIRFLARSGNHNNFWLDDISIYHRTLSGIEKVTDVEFLGLYPNPATYKVNVQYELLENSEVAFSLIDRIGKEKIIATEAGKSGSNMISLDLSAESLPAGIYMLRIKTAHGSSIQKLVIQ